MKKKKKQQQIEEQMDLDDDFLLPASVSSNGESASASDLKPSSKKFFALSIEQKHLNPENELKKIFGSKVVQSGQKKKSRGRAYVKSSWLIVPKPNWALMKKTGDNFIPHKLNFNFKTIII